MAVFERMPEINRVMENPFGHGALGLKKRWRIGRELGKEGYDQVIVLPGFAQIRDYCLGYGH